MSVSHCQDRFDSCPSKGIYRRTVTVLDRMFQSQLRGHKRRDECPFAASLRGFFFFLFFFSVDDTLTHVYADVKTILFLRHGLLTPVLKAPKRCRATPPTNVTIQTQHHSRRSAVTPMFKTRITEVKCLWAFFTIVKFVLRKIHALRNDSLMP